MPRYRPELFLINILVSIDKIEQSLRNASYEDFVSNHEKFGSVVRELQEIGESARKLRDIPGPWLKIDVEWRKIIGFRNLVVHRYFAIEPEIIFEVATKEVVVLKKSIIAVLTESGEKEYISRIIAGTRKTYERIYRQQTLDFLDLLKEIICKDK